MASEPDHERRSFMRIVSLLVRVVSFCVMWLIVSEGRPDYWGYGVATVAVATLVSVRTSPLRPLDMTSLRKLPTWVRFGVWFIAEMVVGGVDVARRALGRAGLVDPVEVDADTNCRPLSTVLLASMCANLMPGTLVYRIGTDSVGIHGLAAELDPARGWDQLMQRLPR